MGVSVVLAPEKLTLRAALFLEVGAKITAAMRDAHTLIHTPEAERQRGREAERQRDRETERHMGREAERERQRGREAKMQRGRERQREAERGRPGMSDSSSVLS